MSPTPIIRATRRGLPGWLEQTTGRWVPIMAGAEDPPEPTPDPRPDPTPDPPDPRPDPRLGEAGEAALNAEREARRRAEREARDLRRRVDDHEAAQLSETERLRREADDGRAAAAGATAKLRRANLMVELTKAEHGIADVAAAVKLIDGVEFDGDDEPTNLGARLRALVDEHPLLKGAPPRPTPPVINGPGGGGTPPPPPLTAEELEAATAAGKTPEEFAELKDVRNLDDWNALQAQRAARKP